MAEVHSKKETEANKSSKKVEEIKAKTKDELKDADLQEDKAVKAAVQKAAR